VDPDAASIEAAALLADRNALRPAVAGRPKDTSETSNQLGQAYQFAATKLLSAPGWQTSPLTPVKITLLLSARL